MVHISESYRTDYAYAYENDVLTCLVHKFDILSRGDNVVYQRNEEDDPE
jgi:hypothetical protein